LNIDQGPEILVETPKGDHQIQSCVYFDKSLPSPIDPGKLESDQGVANNEENGDPADEGD
jgi:hypothetical protein